MSRHGWQAGDVPVCGLGLVTGIVHGLLIVAPFWALVAWWCS